ncbi:MAG: hypothetical protein K6T26_04620 [Alicyclobacillus sp.]|nr:hypothetical protein [Alicyclobacillus sp.]
MSEVRLTGSAPPSSGRDLRPVEVHPVTPPGPHSPTDRGRLHKTGITGGGKAEAAAGAALSAEMLPERSLPLAVLRQPLWREVEWAWRQVLGAAVRAVSAQRTEVPPIPDSCAALATGSTAAPTYDSPLGEGPPSGTRAGDGAAAVETAAVALLWRWLEDLAEAAEAGGQVQWSTPATASLFDFARVWPGAEPHSALGSTAPEAATPARQAPVSLGHPTALLAAWAAGDRLTAAVAAPDGRVRGGGVWLPRLPAAHEPNVPALRWQGERWSGAFNGRTVHRLRLTLPWSDGPAAVLECVAVPTSLWLHLAVPTGWNQARLRAGEGTLRQALARTGWQLQAWHVTEWGEEAP